MIEIEQGSTDVGVDVDVGSSEWGKCCAADQSPLVPAVDSARAAGRVYHGGAEGFVHKSECSAVYTYNMQTDIPENRPML